MTINRLHTHQLLQPQEVPPSRDDFEVVGAFNPGAIRANGEIVMLVRVAERPRARRDGHIGLPRWDSELGLTVDWVAESGVDWIDPRVVRVRESGLLRLNFTSHLRVARCGDGRAVTALGKAFQPTGVLEEFGVEDPRITMLNGRYYFTYVCVSRHGPATAIASTTDFDTFERHGVVFCPENKDVVLFPELIGGAFVALHRPVCGTPFTTPEIWLARSPDLTHWGQHQPMRLKARHWQTGRVGSGAPPIRTENGWLEIYHGNRRPAAPGEVGTYFGGALLLDLNHPQRVTHATPEPILHPEMDFERNGFVPEVVFPTGVIPDGDRLLVYYGAADRCTAMVELSLADVLNALRPADR